MEWVPDIQLEQHLPCRIVLKPRAYSNIVFEPSTSLLVASSVTLNKFASYDDDGNILWEPDGEAPHEPQMKSLMLFTE